MQALDILVSIVAIYINISIEGVSLITSPIYMYIYISMYCKPSLEVFYAFCCFSK